MADLTTSEGINIKRQGLIFFGFWFIIPFCSFAIHQIFAVPPTLILFFIGTLILVSTSRSISTPMAVVFPLMCVGYYGLTQPLIGAPVDRYMGVICAIGYFIITVCFGHQLSLSQRRSLVEKFIFLSIALLTVECAWRITHPQTFYSMYEGTGDVRWIYQYKIGGFMYSDSNVAAVHLLVIFFFLIYQEEEFGIKRPKSKLMLLILLLLTFSRASWAGTVIGWVYIKYLRNKRMDFYIVNFLILAVMFLLVYKFYLAPKLESDLSFRSKFHILETVLTYLSEASFSELLFGIGFSNSEERLGIYAHNFFIVFLTESGIIGFLFMILLFAQFILITRKKALFIIVPFLIATMSNTVTFMPYFYVIMGLMFLDQREKQLRTRAETFHS